MVPSVAALGPAVACSHPAARRDTKVGLIQINDPLVPMNLLLVLMVLLVIVLTYMARHGGYGP
jgi:hypothetical protein